jgi:outer membrane protein OmpA-like peptidoglycan-associated protein
MRRTEGFWLSYIDALTVLVAIFLLVFVFTFNDNKVLRADNEKLKVDNEKLSIDVEKYRLYNEEMISFTNAWERAARKLEELGAQPTTNLKSGGWKLDIAENILFALNSAELNQEGLDLINQIGKIFEEFTQNEMVEKTIRIVVGGHTDPTGFKSLNLNLSDDRANNVAEILRKILKSKNITIESIGYGSRYPKKGGTSYDEQRRITITIQPIAVDYLK